MGAAEGFDPSVTMEGSSHRPEPADVARLARRGLRAVVRAARVEPEVSVAAVLGAHLGPDAGRWPVVADQWAAYDHVNVHTAVEAWLADPVRRATIIGLTGFQHRELALGDLLVEQGMYGMPLGIGTVRAGDRDVQCRLVHYVPSGQDFYPRPFAGVTSGVIQLRLFREHGVSTDNVCLLTEDATTSLTRMPQPAAQSELSALAGHGWAVSSGSAGVTLA